MSDNKKEQLQVNIQDLKHSDDEAESQYEDEKTKEKLDASQEDNERQQPESDQPDLKDKDDDYKNQQKSSVIESEHKYVKYFKDNFKKINSEKTLVDCKSIFECYLIDNQEVVGFDKDQTLKKISLLVKERQGKELICKQILLQTKFTEILKQANEILKLKEKTNIYYERDDEKKDEDDEKEQEDNKSKIKEEKDNKKPEDDQQEDDKKPEEGGEDDINKLKKQKKEDDNKPEGEKKEGDNKPEEEKKEGENKPEEEKKEDEIVTTFRLSTNKQELLFGTSLGKIISVGLDNFILISVYQIRKRLSGDEGERKIIDIDSNDKMIICIDNDKDVYRIMKKIDYSEEPIIKKIKINFHCRKIYQVSPYSNHFILQEYLDLSGTLFDSEKLLFEQIKYSKDIESLLGCFLDNQSFAYIQDETDLKIVSLINDNETYKKENKIEGLAILELQFDKDNQCLVLLEFHRNQKLLELKILDLQGNEFQQSFKAIKTKGIKAQGLNFYLKMYDGTKILKINQPENSFKEEVLSFSIDDSNYYGKIDDQPFIYQIHNNTLLQKEFKGNILSKNQINFLDSEKNIEKANDYSESQRKIDLILNQESNDILGATQDYKVIFVKEKGTSFDDGSFHVFYNQELIDFERYGVQSVQIESDTKSYITNGEWIKQLVIKTEGKLDLIDEDISHRLGKLIIQEGQKKSEEDQLAAAFQIEKIKLTSSKKSLIVLSQNRIIELDLQNQKTEALQYDQDFNNKNYFKIIDFEIFEDDDYYFSVTNSESEILICEIIKKEKEDITKKKVKEVKKFEVINKILIHKKEFVYLYYLGKKRAVSIGYEGSNTILGTMPNKEKSIEMFYWDTSDKKYWKKLFSFDNHSIKIIYDHRCLPEAFILDDKVRLFSQAEKELSIDFSKFDKNHDLRIFGPSFSNFFFQRVKILTELKDEKEKEQQLNQLGQFVVYPYGYTLLGYLVLQKETDLVKQLLNCEKVKFIKDLSGNTPLTYALAIKNHKIINLLLKFISNNEDLIEIVNPRELYNILKLQPENWHLLLAKTVCQVEQDVELEMLEDAKKSYLEENLDFPKYNQNTQKLIEQLTNDKAKAEDKKQVIVKQTLIPIDIMHGSAETTMLLREIQLFENQEIYKQEFVINLIKYKWESISRINDFFLIIQIIQTFAIWIHSYKPGERLYLFIMLVSSFIYIFKELIICMRLHYIKQDFKKKSNEQNQQTQQSTKICPKNLKEIIQGFQSFTAFTSWLAVLVFLLQTTYTLTNLISVISYVDYILPISNLVSWIVLVQELGTFEIVMKFHIIFILSVRGLQGFIIYFFLMLVTFSSTQGILKKTLVRIEKIGDESQPTSPEFYKMHNAFIVDEHIFQDGFDNLQFVWKAIMSGEYEIEGEEGFFIRIYGWVTALLANVILLNLIVAIMGDTYEESITSMKEKLLKEQAYRIVRHQCFFIEKEKKEKCLIWMEYNTDQIGETWISQADMISSTVKKYFEKVFAQIQATENKQQDQLTKIENKMQDVLKTQMTDSKIINDLKTVLSDDKKKAEEIKKMDSTDNKKSDEVKVDSVDSNKVDEIKVSQTVDGLKFDDFLTEIKNIQTNMKAQVAQGQGQATEMQAQVVDIKTQQTKMQAEQTQIQVQVVDIKTQQTKMQAEQTQIQVQVVDIKGQVNEIKNQLTEFINYMKEKQ